MARVFLIALRNLREHWIRTTLLGLSIILVMILLVMLMGLSGGIQGTILRSATTLATGHVNVGGFYKIDTSTSRPAVTDFGAVEAVIRQAAPEADFIVRRGRGGFDRIVSESGSLRNAIIGVEVGKERNFGDVLKVVDGDLSQLGERGTALLFKRQATDLGVGVGDTVTVAGPTARGFRNTLDVRVAAIVEDMGLLSLFTTYIDHESLRELYQFADTTTGGFLLYLSEPGESDAVAARLRDALEAAGYELLPPEAKAFWQKQSDVNREDWTGQRLDVSTWRDEVANLTAIVDGLNAVGGVLVTMLLLIIMTGITIVMWVSIRRRTREIGTLRAIGMPRGQVRLMIVVEAALLSGIFATLGAALGMVLAAVINATEMVVPNQAAQVFLMNDVLILDIDLSGIATAVVAITLVSAAFALLPAFRASKITPAEALRHAG